MHGELTLARKRLYQGTRIGPERDAGTERRGGRRDLHGLATIDLIGNGVIIAAARDARSGNRDFGASAAAANRELHRTAA